MSDIVETIPFNFEELYTSLEEKFKDKGYDIDEGSNTAQLITAMAYLTSMLNVNTAININETMLPLATKRTNILQNARNLGYEIEHRSSYRYRLTLKFEAGNHTIHKHTKFTQGENSYVYMGQQVDLYNVDAGYEITLDVTEGTMKSYEEFPDTLSIITANIIEDNKFIEQYYVDIPYIDVEEDGLEVFLTYYDDAGTLFNQEVWKKASKFMIDSDTILNKEYMRLDDIEFNTPRIYFKLASSGVSLRAGTKIEINALISKGTEGAMADITSPSTVTHNLVGVEVTNILVVAQGTDEESSESIKLNAPMFHNSANRAITKMDYTAICDRQTSVNSSHIWGGDDEYPKKPGRVWFSFTPTTLERTYTSNTYNTEFLLNDTEDIINWYIETEEIKSSKYNIDGTVLNPGIWDILDEYKIPTLIFQNRHPIYLDFNYNLNIVKYNVKISKPETHKLIFDIIDEYFLGDGASIPMESFGSEYLHSNLEKRIDAGLMDTSGFNNSVTTRLMLTSKNVTFEHLNKANQEIVIPLAVPFESYFDNNGDIIPSVLPNIDTENFIIGDIYTNWELLEGNELNEDIIRVDINLKNSETFIGVDGQMEYDIILPVYNIPVISIDGVDLTHGVEFWKLGQTITFDQPLSDGAVVVINLDEKCGDYYILNSYRKSIFIRLLINGSNPAEGLTNLPGEFLDMGEEVRSMYFSTIDDLYLHTTDGKYVTTDGYSSSIFDDGMSLDTTQELISDASYASSPLTTDDFIDAKYLNLSYNSPNFRLFKNTIPRLNSVNFI